LRRDGDADRDERTEGIPQRDPDCGDPLVVLLAVIRVATLADLVELAKEGAA
jgi:hypothetical protein